MRRLLVDIAWCIGTFVLVTVVGYWVRQQGVELPSLPDWLTGV